MSRKRLQDKFCLHFCASWIIAWGVSVPLLKNKMAKTLDATKQLTAERPKVRTWRQRLNTTGSAKAPPTHTTHSSPTHLRLAPTLILPVSASIFLNPSTTSCWSVHTATSIVFTLVNNVHCTSWIQFCRAFKPRPSLERRPSNYLWRFYFSRETRTHPMQLLRKCRNASRICPEAFSCSYLHYFHMRTYFFIPSSQLLVYRHYFCFV